MGSQETKALALLGALTNLKNWIKIEEKIKADKQEGQQRIKESIILGG